MPALFKNPFAVRRLAVELRGIRIALERIARVQEAKAGLRGGDGAAFRSFSGFFGTEGPQEKGSAESYADEELAEMEAARREEARKAGRPWTDWGQEDE